MQEVNYHDKIKHIFFGIPIIVTQNDIDKNIMNGELPSSQMENYESIRNNYSRVKGLRKQVNYEKF